LIGEKNGKYGAVGEIFAGKRPDNFPQIDIAGD
jgi:hypothetical protein